MPAVSRIADLCIPHPTCPMPHTLITGSPNTYCNGRPISFETCATTPHFVRIGKWCVIHVGLVVTGATTVIVNGMPMARIGSLLYGPPYCTAVAQGSVNVFAGGI